jgi:hypothetical protein
MMWILLSWTNDDPENLQIAMTFNNIQNAWRGWKQHVGDCATRIHCQDLMEYEDIWTAVPAGRFTARHYKMMCSPIPTT